MGVELKPCPWCGGEASGPHDNSYGDFFVGCGSKCPSEPAAFGNTATGAAMLWNRRARERTPAEEGVIRAAVAWAERWAWAARRAPGGTAQNTLIEAVDALLKAQPEWGR